MKIELLCAKEAAILLQRDLVKYYKPVLSMYVSSLIYPRTSKVFRAGYFSARHLDDILDGDRKFKNNPYAYAHKIREQIAEGNNNSSLEIMGLFNYAIEKIEEIKKETNNPRKEWLTFIDAMIYDFERKSERIVLPEKKLREHYINTYSPLANISLTMLKSKIRLKDIPKYAETQGRIYSVRDLKDDWNNGIINIPEEVLEKEKLWSDMSFDEIEKNTGIMNWKVKELIESRRCLLDVDRYLRTKSDLKTQVFFNGLIISMLKYIHKNC